MMRIQLSKTIYVYVLLVVLITFFLQLSRFDSILTWSKHSNRTESEVPPVNALTNAEIAQLQREHILLLYNPKELHGDQIKYQFEKVLDFMKKQYTTQEIHSFTGEVDLYSTIIFAFSELDQLPNNEWIEAYVRDGGTIFFARSLYANNTLQRLAPMLGIKKYGSLSVSTGIQLHSPVLLQIQELQYEVENLSNTSLYVELQDEVVVHATNPAQVPLLWEVTYGKGKVMVLNGTMLVSKNNRGILVGALSMLVPDFIYPIFNMKLVYIDDFPAPFPEGFNDLIYDEYKMTNEQFYKEVWWPDMLRLANRYDLKYTAGVIENYEDNVKPPFPVSSHLSLSNLIVFGRELLKNSGEIGLHGYNHQSLILDQTVADQFGYKSWRNVEDMKQSVYALHQFVTSIFPNYEFQTYIPPSNVLSPEGREALKQSLPNLTNISSTYLMDPTGTSYTQEYEVAADGIVELPRITSGYSYDEMYVWETANAVSSLGIFSHFVHPDDVISEDRGFGHTWEELYEQFDQYLQTIHKRYSWLRSMTASEAANELKKFFQTEVYFEQHPNRIYGYMNHFTGDMYFVLRTTKKITDEVHCTLQRIDEGVYLVQAWKEKFEIGLSDS